MPKKQNDNKTHEMDFETALAELQKIVTRMENDQQSLDASIADYEKGTALASICQRHLDNAQLKVDKLVKTKNGHRFEALQDNHDA